MMKSGWKTVLAGGVALATLGATSVAAAQEAADEDIIVTAQRREQNVQDVPITVSVVTADTINALAADDIGDISVFVPGLAVSNASPTQARYTIRGVTTSDFGVGTDPAVGVYVDGVYAARSGAGLLAFSDVARIEVLKGPQGTLFGRNSAAGAVSITTNLPSDEFEARLSLRAGDYNHRRAEAMVNLPINDDLALRVNALVNRRDGWLEDAATGADYDQEDNWALRAAVLWDLSPETRAVLSYTHDNVDQDARPAIGVAPIPAAPGLPTVPPDPSTYTSPFTGRILNDAIDNHETRSLDEATLTLTHSFGSFDFTSITSARYFETENREDEDGTNRIDLYFDTNNREKNHSWYQEFRIAGESGAFNWIAGVSYYDEHAQQRSDSFATTNTIDTLTGGLFSTADVILGLYGIDQTTLGYGWGEDMINDGEFQASAIFTDVIWSATDRLNLTFGLRYTRDEKTFSWFNGPRIAPELDAVLADPNVEFALSTELGPFFDYFFADFIFDQSSLAGVACDNGVTVQEGVVCEMSDSWENLSPRFVADYQLTDDVMLFFSYAQGYKAGGFNSVQEASRFDNEEVENFEIGIKSDPNASLRFNLSVFSYIYEGKQSINLIDPDDGGPALPQYLIQTSDDEAWGLDLQMDWTPIEGLTLFTNAQYIDATFKSRVTDGGLDLSGQPTGEPFWSAAAGAAYHYNLSDMGSVDLLLTYAYRGEGRCNDDSVAQGSCLPTGSFDPAEAQHRTDFRAYWTSPDERYELGFYVNNLFDDQYVTGINNITANTLGTPFVNVTEPRLVGVDFTFTY